MAFPYEETEVSIYSLPSWQMQCLISTEGPIVAGCLSEWDLGACLTRSPNQLLLIDASLGKVMKKKDFEMCPRHCAIDWNAKTVAVAFYGGRRKSFHPDSQFRQRRGL